MKKYLLLLLPFVACSKDEDTPANGEATLTGKTWVCDSAYTIIGNNRIVDYVKAPTYLKVVYKTDGTYTVSSSYDQDVTKNYELFGNKVFYWTIGGQKDANQFMVIEKLTADFYHSSQTKLSGEKIGYYYHAQ